MSEDAVEPQEVAEPIEQILEQAAPADVVQEESAPDENREKTMVPLSALQKLREKKRELELELQWERQRNAQAAQKAEHVEDNARYESATREDLINSQAEAIRIIEEKLWIRQNPEKYEKINENLSEFLKTRQHLSFAIDKAPNRYEEAYNLMEALSPKQKQQLKTAASPKKESPNSPGGVPKAAALSESVDLMNMSDKEFAEWRQSKRRAR